MTGQDAITERIIGCAIEVHCHLGPGLTENTYEEALCMEFELIGHASVHQAQTLTYMRVLKLRKGLLINFNTDVVRNGIKRMAL